MFEVIIEEFKNEYECLDGWKRLGILELCILMGIMVDLAIYLFSIPISKGVGLLEGILTILLWILVGALIIVFLIQKGKVRIEKGKRGAAIEKIARHFRCDGGYDFSGIDALIAMAENKTKNRDGFDYILNVVTSLIVSIVANIFLSWYKNAVDSLFPLGMGIMYLITAVGLVDAVCECGYIFFVIRYVRYIEYDDLINGLQEFKLSVSCCDESMCDMNGKSYFVTVKCKTSNDHIGDDSNRENTL